MARGNGVACSDADRFLARVGPDAGDSLGRIETSSVVNSVPLKPLSFLAPTNSWPWRRSHPARAPSIGSGGLGFVRDGLSLCAVGITIRSRRCGSPDTRDEVALFGVAPMDPITFAAVPVTLLVATIAASYLPARRVSAVDPVKCLRLNSSQGLWGPPRRPSRS